MMCSEQQNSPASQGLQDYFVLSECKDFAVKAQNPCIFFEESR
jgi:hypothetical protein